MKLSHNYKYTYKHTQSEDKSLLLNLRQKVPYKNVCLLREDYHPQIVNQTYCVSIN